MSNIQFQGHDSTFAWLHPVFCESNHLVRRKIHTELQRPFENYNALKRQDKYI